MGQGNLVRIQPSASLFANPTLCEAHRQVARRLMPERPYRGTGVQNKVFGPPRIHLPFSSMNRGVAGLITRLEPEWSSTCRSWSTLKGESR
jgi:hypothetical protein